MTMDHERKIQLAESEGQSDELGKQNMRICLTIPSLTPPHGGLRIILEWANRLLEWHDVYLLVGNVPRPITLHSKCDWFTIDPRIKLKTRELILDDMDCLVVCSPHHSHLLDRLHPFKKFVFMQMAEHHFRPNDPAWMVKCRRFYMSEYPILSISKWNMQMLTEVYKQEPENLHYITNGVNFHHFPLAVDPKKNRKTVLVEGWESLNPSKDPDSIGPLVARRLKASGHRILAFSQHPLETMPEVPDEFYVKPSLPLMNELYERAEVMLKVSRLDARSCSPMEAMTKQTIVVRGIEQGDDDLRHGGNCFRFEYNDINGMVSVCENLMRDVNQKILVKMGQRVQNYVCQNCNWDTIMPSINEILTK